MRYIYIYLLCFAACESDFTTSESHVISGCLDDLACNYNAEATQDDSSCEYPLEYYNCFGDCINDSDNDDICDELENSGIRVTVFLYENCPIAQYMCGPLRDTYRYFCDTLNEVILFQGFSPNAFSTQASLIDFVIKYDIPFDVTWDYSQINNEPGPYTQLYLPIVTPEVFIEFNGNLVYRGMIDNSYEELGQWSPPTENFLHDILMQLISGEEFVYSETEAIGCFINY